jgi:hypothetical protein
MVLVLFLSEEIRYYKGKHKVKVVTQAEGYWIVEAMEQFEDTLDGEKVTVDVGEKRIVPPSSVHKHKTLPPIVQEHTYERRMEKKLKRMIDEEGKNQPPQEAHPR